MYDLTKPLQDVIARAAPGLHVPDSIEAACILKAIAWVESSGGARATAAKFERSWSIGGRNFANAPEEFRHLRWDYGDLIACSYGSFQVMYPTAWTHGYRGDPVKLRDDAFGVRYVIKHLNHKVFDRYTNETIRDVFDAYNSGTARDRYVPEEYIRRASAAYKVYST